MIWFFNNFIMQLPKINLGFPNLQQNQLILINSVFEQLNQILMNWLGFSPKKSQVFVDNFGT